MSQSPSVPAASTPRSSEANGSENRLDRPRDLTATIYSVLGIDWTKKPVDRTSQHVDPVVGTKRTDGAEVTGLFT